jgi:hypothetical protein
VECPKCRTRYLLTFTSYRNGSYLASTLADPSEDFFFYCSCAKPAVCIHGRWSELNTYVVSKAAHERGYGSGEEIVSVGHGQHHMPSSFVTNPNPIRRGARNERQP